MEILKEIDIYITTIFQNVGAFAPLLASIFLVIESIVPILPLAFFITINFMYFGTFLGFILSWLLTIVGCYISFIFFRKFFMLKFDNKFLKNNEGKMFKLMKIIDNLKLEELTLLLAMPFAPAFLLNIVAGLSKVSKKKFLIALFVGKIFLVYFWGIVGTTLLESLKDPKKIIIVIALSLLAFFAGKIVNKKLNIE